MPLHPLLFAAYPVLALFQHNAHQTTPGEIVTPLLVTLALAAGLVILFTRILSDRGAGALIASLTLILIFSAGWVTQAAEALEGDPISRNAAYWASSVVILGTALRAVRGIRPRASESLGAIATVFSASLVGTAVVQTLASEAGAAAIAPLPIDFRTHLFESQGEVRLPPDATDRPRRDIFLLVFDRYAGNESLREYYGFDNSEITDFLRGEGFIVPDEHLSNYPSTINSLTSALNMQYLREQSGEPWYRTGSIHPLVTALGDNLFLETLTELGYESWHLGSFWEPTAVNPSAMHNFNFTVMSEFSKALFQSTMLAGISQGLVYSREQWHRVREQIAMLPDLKSTAPLFVMAHFTVPHPPAVLAADGSFVFRPLAGPAEARSLYLGQVSFVNNSLREIIPALKRRNPAPIIIIQPDEGPRPDGMEQSDDLEDFWRSAPEAVRRAKLSIFAAYYLPDLESSPQPASLSPVNSLRTVLREYFGATLPDLPVRHFLPLELENPYRLREVSPENALRYLAEQ